LLTGADQCFLLFSFSLSFSDSEGRRTVGGMARSERRGCGGDEQPFQLCINRLNQKLGEFGKGEKRTKLDGNLVAFAWKNPVQILRRRQFLDLNQKFEGLPGKASTEIFQLASN
jgi:hypothetical protein